MSALDDAAWPLGRLGEAVEALARHAGLDPRAPDRVPAPPSEDRLWRWVEDLAAWLGVEAAPVAFGYGDARRFVRGAAPALLCVRDDGGRRYLALLDAGPRRATLLAPSGELVRVSVRDVVDFVVAPIEARAAPAIDALLARAQVPEARRAAARRALFAARLSGEQIGGSYLLDLAPSAPILAHARRARIGRGLAVFLAAYAASYALVLGAWVVIGRGALGGRIDRGWLIAWGLLLATQLPLRVLGSWAGGRAVLGAGAIVKRRLLGGALALDADALRGSGAGQLFGRVIESEALEALGLGGGVTAVVAALELGFVALVLALGAAPAAHLIALALWTLATLLVTARYFRAREAWTDARLGMTHDLVERMVGHRTRLAQEPIARRHDGEDESLARYLHGSSRMDHLGVWLGAVVPRGFLLLGLALLAPAFVSGAASGALAVSLGGVLLAQRAFARLSAGLAELVGAAVAYRVAAPLFAAASRAPRSPSPELTRASLGDGPVIDAHDLTFRRAGRADPILAGVDLRVELGDRLLLEGPSGSGKSTLGAILAGLVEPTTGLLLVGGLDRHTLGAAGFRRRVAAAPQFHDNHVVSATLAFNLLMGRAWPPTPEDLELAEIIVGELGLGPLVERMPGGLFQQVGETGWQLSHGERSRLFIARALLQDADLIVLDESFGALDPETLGQAMSAVLRRARSVLIIAHP